MSVTDLLSRISQPAATNTLPGSGDSASKPPVRDVADVAAAALGNSPNSSGASTSASGPADSNGPSFATRQQQSRGANAESHETNVGTSTTGVALPGSSVVSRGDGLTTNPAGTNPGGSANSSAAPPVAGLLSRLPANPKEAAAQAQQSAAGNQPSKPGSAPGPFADPNVKLPDSLVAILQQLTNGTAGTEASAAGNNGSGKSNSASETALPGTAVDVQAAAFLEKLAQLTSNPGATSNESNALGPIQITPLLAQLLGGTTAANNANGKGRGAAPIVGTRSGAHAKGSPAGNPAASTNPTDASNSTAGITGSTGQLNSEQAAILSAVNQLLASGTTSIDGKSAAKSPGANNSSANTTTAVSAAAALEAQIAQALANATSSAGTTDGTASTDGSNSGTDESKARHHAHGDPTTAAPTTLNALPLPVSLPTVVLPTSGGRTGDATNAVVNAPLSSAGRGSGGRNSDRLQALIGHQAIESNLNPGGTAAGSPTGVGSATTLAAQAANFSEALGAAIGGHSASALAANLTAAVTKSTTHAAADNQASALAAAGLTANVGTIANVNPIDAAAKTEQTPTVDPYAVVNQVSQAVLGATETGREFTFILSPPKLGLVKVELVQRDGVLTTRLQTETSEARDLINEHLSELQTTLQGLGANASPIEVIQSDRLRQEAPRFDALQSPGGNASGNGGQPGAGGQSGGQSANSDGHSSANGQDSAAAAAGRRTAFRQRFAGRQGRLLNADL